MAAGMAKEGAIPVFGVYSTFLQRSYDMLIHDVAIDHLHVVLGVDRAGLVGEDGETTMASLMWPIWIASRDDSLCALQLPGAGGDAGAGRAGNQGAGSCPLSTWRRGDVYGQFRQRALLFC